MSRYGWRPNSNNSASFNNQPKTVSHAPRNTSLGYQPSREKNPRSKEMKMATIRKIKKDGGLPDYYYVMPNQDRIDILVVRSKNSGNTYTCVLPAPHGSMTFNKMNEMRAYFDEHFES